MLVRIQKSPGKCLGRFNQCPPSSEIIYTAVGLLIRQATYLQGSPQKMCDRTSAQTFSWLQLLSSYFDTQLTSVEIKAHLATDQSKYEDTGNELLPATSHAKELISLQLLHTSRPTSSASLLTYNATAPSVNLSIILRSLDRWYLCLAVGAQRVSCFSFSFSFSVYVCNCNYKLPVQCIYWRVNGVIKTQFNEN